MWWSTSPGGEYSGRQGGGQRQPQQRRDDREEVHQPVADLHHAGNPAGKAGQNRVEVFGVAVDVAVLGVAVEYRRSEKSGRRPEQHVQPRLKRAQAGPPGILQPSLEQGQRSGDGHSHVEHRQGRRQAHRHPAQRQAERHPARQHPHRHHDAHRHDERVDPVAKRRHGRERPALACICGPPCGAGISKPRAPQGFSSAPARARRRR